MQGLNPHLLCLLHWHAYSLLLWHLGQLEACLAHSKSFAIIIREYMFLPQICFVSLGTGLWLTAFRREKGTGSPSKTEGLSPESRARRAGPSQAAAQTRGSRLKEFLGSATYFRVQKKMTVSLFACITLFPEGGSEKLDPNKAQSSAGILHAVFI